MSERTDVPAKVEVEADEATRPGRTYQPHVDIAEGDDVLYLWADIPGVEEKSLDVHYDDGVLSIEGRVSVDEYENLTPRYTEYNVGNFERRFRLSTDIEVERIVAHVRHGVLELELPKAARARRREIPIHS